MRILCCYYGGNSRSVSLAMLLKLNHGQRDVLSVGLGYTSEATKRVLFDWSDVIVIVGERFLFDLVPGDQQRKIVWVNIGPDRWYNPTHPELVGKLLKVLDFWGKNGAILFYTDPELPPELLDIKTSPCP